MIKSALVKKLIKECDDLAEVFDSQRNDAAGSAAEKRYKVVVLTILPLLLGKLSLLLFLLGGLFGMLLTHIVLN